MSTSKQARENFHNDFDDWKVLAGGTSTGLIAFVVFGILWINWTAPSSPRRDKTSHVVDAAAIASFEAEQDAPTNGKRIEETNSAYIERGEVQFSRHIVTDDTPKLVRPSIGIASNTTVDFGSIDWPRFDMAKLVRPARIAGTALTTAFGAFREVTANHMDKALVAVNSKLNSPTQVEVDFPRRMNERELLAELKNVSGDFDIRSIDKVVERINEKVVAKKKWDRPSAVAERNRSIYLGADKPLASLDDDDQFHPLFWFQQFAKNEFGMPFRMGDECNIDPAAIPKMEQISRDLTSAVVRTGDPFAASFPASGSFGGSSRQTAATPDAIIAKYVAEQEYWRKSESVSGLMQTTQAIGLKSRMELIRSLDRINTPESSRALAKRAIFDMREVAREVAVKALQHRPPDDFRDELFRGLRYPWAPVSEHAANALVELDDRSTVLPLIKMLDEADPRVPFQNDNGEWVVREMTRVNHMRNCNLCHPPSLAKTDNLRGLVPVPGQRLPSLYYSSERPNSQFVRADSTYIKQDFSLTEAVKDAAPWPDKQRFDYFVRQRKLSKLESELLSANQQDDQWTQHRASYPQREAVLYALRELTGRDEGNRSADWKRYYVNLRRRAGL